MNLLVLFLVMAAVLGWALIYFLRAKDGPATGDKVEVILSGGQSGDPAADKDRQFLGDAIFSNGDWDFIRREGSESLKNLFIEERRTLAARWLNDSAERIRAVRANHLRGSRYSQNLDVLAELKLLLLFLYLISLCRCMLLVVRIARPTAPRTLALHFERMAGRLRRAQDGVLSRVPAEQAPRSRP
jgi:hypothetical protein